MKGTHIITASIILSIAIVLAPIVFYSYKMSDCLDNQGTNDIAKGYCIALLNGK